MKLVTGLEQQPLDLGDDRARDPLYAAYSQTRLAELGITFEKARIIPHLRLPLERVARAVAAARSVA